MKRTTFIPLSLALAASAFADNTFYFNEAGYDSDQPISIVVKSTDNLEGQKWTLWFDPDGGMTGASVATGTFGAGVNPDNWTNNGKYYTINLAERPSALLSTFFSPAVASRNLLSASCICLPMEVISVLAFWMASPAEYQLVWERESD